MLYKSIKVTQKLWRAVYFYLLMGELYWPHALEIVLLEYGTEIPEVIKKYSQLSLSRLRLSRITAYLEEKIWSLL